MRQLATVVDNVVALLMRQLLTWTLTAVLMVFFLPRYLGDDGLGKVTFAVSLITMLLVLTNLGTATFTVKQVALDRARVSDLLWNTYAIRALTAVPIAAVVVSVTRLVPLESDAKAVLYLASATMIVMALDKAQVAAIQGLEKMRWIGAAEVANKATVMALGITVLVMGHGVVAYATVLLAGAAMSFAVNGSYLVWRYLRWPRFSRAVVRQLLVGGFPFVITGTLGQIYIWMDVFVVRIMTRDEVVGWLGAATQLYATFNVVPLVIATAILPALTRFHVEDTEAMGTAVRRSIQAVLVTGMPLALALMLLSGDIIHFLHYPQEFNHSVPLLALLAVNVPVTGALMVLGTVVIAANQQKRWAFAMFVTTALTALLDPALVLTFDRWVGNGAIGAVTTTVVSEMVMINLGLRLVPKGLIDRSVVTMLLRALSAALVMVGVMGAAKLLLEPGLVPLVLIGGPTYGLALLANGGVTIGELRLLTSLAFGRGRAQGPGLAGEAASPYGAAPMGSRGA
jgi:O-antigen/teichoic acid export membrane protein